MRRFELILALALIGTTLALAAPPDANDGGHRRPACVRLMLEDQPVAFWSMETADGKVVPSLADVAERDVLAATIVGGAKLKQPGPRPSEFPLFDSDNEAVSFSPNNKAFLRVKDPGEGSSLDFTLGDTITLEAWVQPLALKEGQQVYVVGKGRTNNDGQEKDNQNYALRIRCIDGTGRLSFLFRSAGKDGEFHRWNSSAGFAADSGWHHIAVTFTFGKAASIRGFIDGKETQGTWDMAGASDRAPVVDNDELWIGSSMGGSGDATFVGLIDEVALYRTSVSAERMQARYQYSGPPALPEVDPSTLPTDRVQVQIIEKITERSWNIARGQQTLAFDLPAFALSELPRKYNERGIIVDRSSPFIVVLQMRKEMPAGKYRVLLRGLNASRVLVDGKVLGQTDFLKATGSGHEHVPLPKDALTDVRLIPQGHQERLVTVELAAGEHVFRHEIVVGGNKLRPEIGESSLALATESGPFSLLTAAGREALPFNDVGWEAITSEVKSLLQRVNMENRQTVAAEENAYWQRRHDWGREEMGKLPKLEVPAATPNYPANNAVDHFINAGLAAKKTEPTAILDDYAFLRRVTLDTVGVLPSRAELAAFLAADAKSRRAAAIERLLADPRAADHGVAYWQDVLAENPGIVKPTLNNTGPFRVWIYEALLDHKPVDRFATELTMMEGSRYYGGPAGFAIATENDAPLAEKANILAKAFLGQEMKCARCHDAPSHPFEQKELFSLAAMLNRQPLKLPAGSTVPPLPGGRVPIVKVVLKPGQEIKPVWPFTTLTTDDLPAGILRDPNDSRERLAALISSPTNSRFAQTAVNRLWKRLLGRGIVDPVDDWAAVKPSHPELLDYLARELVTQNYDLAHVTRLILNSHLYQRQTTDDFAGKREFAGPTRRRMTAEQIVDSLYAAAGKTLDVEPITLDPEGRLTVDTFLNLGTADRAWQFCSLSTERDRPSLGLPRAQAVVDLLMSFGWRDYRPSPITDRDEEPNVLQPLAVANGLVSTRIVRLSDDSAFTKLALQAETPETLAQQVFLQVLSRPPTKGELAAAVAILKPGFEDRLVTATSSVKHQPRRQESVSWSNHLSPEATEIKYRVEKEVAAGDPPTDRLQADWRQRLEDVIWAAINTPNFVFVP